MKLIHIAILIALAVALAVILSYVGDTSNYVTFEQAEKYADRYPHKDYHVVVKLNNEKPMTYNPTEDPNYFSFFATDSVGVERLVVYHNSKPQDLERTDKIVVIGKAKDDHFEAVDILKKCHSKYEKDLQTESEQ
jgi:cytochrome c-type biogenesis protein CcmE